MLPFKICKFWLTNAHYVRTYIYNPLLFLILQVSSGTLDRARSLMRRILELCNTPLEQGSEAMKLVQQRSFHSVARHLVKEVISSNENVRKQVSC